MLKDRLKSAAVLISITLLLLWADHKLSSSSGKIEAIALVPLLLFLALGTAWDIASMLTNSGRPIRRAVTLCSVTMIVLSSVVPLMWPVFGGTYPVDCSVGRLGWIVIGAIAGVFMILLAEMKDYGKEESEETGTIERTCHASFVSLYVGLPMALLVAFRFNWGIAGLITLVAVTKSTDTGAYFTGKLFGKNKLIPRLSPGKTWEGAIGGVVTATIVAFVCLYWLFDSGGPRTGLSNPIVGALVLGPSLALAGMLGDLAESLVKRDCQAKDSGNWLPGLGGVLDVTDSLIAAVMPAFLCFSAGVGA